MKDVEKIVHKQIRQLASDNKRDLVIDNEMLLNEDLGLGSMTQVALFTNLTDLFKVDILQFTDEDLVNLKRVQDVIRLFEKKVYVSKS